jgi:putative FmdB family regulatory protein
MRKLFDFRCSTCKTKFEVLTEATDTVRCNKCGSPSHRVISPIRCQLDPTSGDFPGATMKWIREHESKGGLTQGK